MEIPYMRGIPDGAGEENERFILGLRGACSRSLRFNVEPERSTQSEVRP